MPAHNQPPGDYEQGPEGPDVDTAIAEILRGDRERQLQALSSDLEMEPYFAKHVDVTLAIAREQGWTAHCAGLSDEEVRHRLIEGDVFGYPSLEAFSAIVSGRIDMDRTDKLDETAHEQLQDSREEAFGYLLYLLYDNGENPEHLRDWVQLAEQAIGSVDVLEGLEPGSNDWYDCLGMLINQYELQQSTMNSYHQRSHQAREWIRRELQEKYGDHDDNKDLALQCVMVVTITSDKDIVEGSDSSMVSDVMKMASRRGIDREWLCELIRGAKQDFFSDDFKL